MFHRELGCVGEAWLAEWGGQAPPSLSGQGSFSTHPVAGRICMLPHVPGPLLPPQGLLHLSTVGVLLCSYWGSSRLLSHERFLSPFLL